MSSARERRARARQGGGGSYQRQRPSPAKAASPTARQPAPKRPSAQAKPQAGRAAAAAPAAAAGTSPVARNPGGARLQAGWQRPRLIMEGGNEVFEREQAVEQAMGFARLRREAERKAAAEEEARKGPVAAALQSERGWAKLMQVADQAGGGHREPLLGASVT